MVLHFMVVVVVVAYRRRQGQEDGGTFFKERRVAHLEAGLCACRKESMGQGEKARCARQVGRYNEMKL